ncbi:MAG: ankyrin repeat domain-containing protein [Bryobacteraceae bacterium]|nr:ankyrin repeat domain-containing protein [Bryobacteraceae bacterium]
MSTELFAAIRSGDLNQVTSLLEANPSLVAARDDKGVSSVLTAAYHGKSDIARLFIERGATLDIFEAAAVGDLARVRELAADANATSPDGFQPLGLACFFGQTAVAEFLILEADADVHVASKNQMRVQPIHAAAARRASSLVGMLLEKGADPNARQHLGYTALHAAAQHGDDATAELLLKAGADPTLASDDGKTPADYAETAGYDSLAARLRS